MAHPDFVFDVFFTIGRIADNIATAPFIVPDTDDQFCIYEGRYMAKRSAKPSWLKCLARKGKENKK